MLLPENTTQHNLNYDGVNVLDVLRNLREGMLSCVLFVCYRYVVCSLDEFLEIGICVLDGCL